MKAKLILACTMAAILLCLFACSPAPTQIDESKPLSPAEVDSSMVDQIVAVNASCADFMESPEFAISQEVEVAVGGSLTVTLGCGLIAGFEWELPKITDQTVLEQVDHKFEAPKLIFDEYGIITGGDSGKEVWTFRALKEGKSTISMEYSLPLEGGIKVTWSFVLTVVVK